MTRKTSAPQHAAALTARRAEFSASLLDWYQRHARVLPWRENPSLYKTVVSEFMLQQTQVKTVLPYFARWQAELPDFAALAAASEARVLKLWEGLGYYSRARNLHRLAQAVAARPAPPRTPDEWRELPGVGPYTAAAITSITFGAPVACVDGNVVRILARLTADATEFRDSGSAAKALAPLADRLVPAARAGDHNQAMMELGATVCTRQNPACLMCPVRHFCAAAEARRLALQHELPSAAHLGLTEATAAKGTLLATKKRGITRYRITESIYTYAAPRGKLADECVWVPLAELSAITLSGPHRRWITEIIARA